MNNIASSSLEAQLNKRFEIARAKIKEQCNISRQKVHEEINKIIEQELNL